MAKLGPHPYRRTNGLKYFRFWLRFRELFEFLWISQGVILRRVNLPMVSYPSESNNFSRFYLKGQSSEIFDLFSSYFKPSWATENWIKICSILVKISPVIQILPWVSYSVESLITPGSLQLFLKTFAQALKGTVSQKQLWIHTLLSKG